MYPVKPMKENTYMGNNGIFIPQILIGVCMTTYFFIETYFVATGTYFNYHPYISMYMCLKHISNPDVELRHFVLSCACNL